MQVTIQDAKSKLSELIEMVEDGEEVVITRNGKPVAALVKVHPKGERVLGSAKGQIKFHEGWDAPMSDSELDEFIGR